MASAEHAFHLYRVAITLSMRLCGRPGAERELW